MNAEDRWKKIFEKGDYPILYQLVSTIFAVPISNAEIERVFSLCAAQWTKERNLLHVDTVKALAQIKCNYDMNCREMYRFLLESDKLLKKIRGNDKY